ncbi:LmbE family N-acetylglucosaminyl deacetylase [Sinomonas atrocyanea]|uniref:PIG-L deacetylase family protein n=1 Tax=Sinomonas atrocyanea TaxID=37927 RepID=UPI002787A858|nr:PIG-L family deacetylase [Sinomonas atrocyanea]MDP9883600.1 LmbE family N-acetylglucosaminyl deacetylase [Sinomonas atrocyanea]
MPPRTLMLVVAHPDDDAIGIAGSIALHGDEPGFRFALVHATDGGAGMIAPGTDTNRADLGRYRRGEDERAWSAHGRGPDRHEWLGYEDGCLCDADFDGLTARIRALLEEERPDVVATFGPDGVTGHPDHIAVGSATDAAFLALAGRGGPGLKRLLHWALKESTWLRINAARTSSGLPPWDPAQVYHFRGIPDELVDMRVDTRAVAERVVAGLAEHRSQRLSLFEHPLAHAAWLAAASHEHFVQAWPPRERRGPLLTDIFEGLG